MIYFPNAKINLGLAVTELRSDGFHHIETCYYPIPLFDVLEFVESSQFELTVFGNQLEGPIEDNLITKVWQLMHREFQVPPVKVALLKKIPTGAGLGGGSSDAAFFIKGLNTLFSLGLSNNQMEAVSAKLGSDCPFFIRNQPAIGKGRGEVLVDVPLSLSGYQLTLVFPGYFISTALAFRKVVPHSIDYSFADVLALHPTKWRYLLVNDFQPVATAMHPKTGQIIDQLYLAGATYASLTGSGSVVFALSEKPLSVLPLVRDFDVYTWAL